MSETIQRDATDGAAENFTSTAKDYDAVVRHNIAGARRLVMSLPDGDYRRVLDVGCGTGWAALSMLERFPEIEQVTGVDPAEGMLAVFTDKVAAIGDGTEIELRTADVMSMGVPDESYDAVISSMAMHWFPDKPGAMVAMARALKPGGTIGILCSGRGGEHEFREVLARIDPPPPKEWDAAFDAVQRDIDEMEQYLAGAGLEPVDVWMERRLRRTSAEAYLERMRVVASHISSAILTEEEIAELMERVTAGIHAVSGPNGFEYTFTKLYAVARKPER
jgi:ubiquinone/menaquinone biosynthesis C-methylase UbiE